MRSFLGILVLFINHCFLVGRKLHHLILSSMIRDPTQDDLFLCYSLVEIGILLSHFRGKKHLNQPLDLS